MLIIILEKICSCNEIVPARSAWHGGATRLSAHCVQAQLHALLTEEERQVIAEGISRYQAFSPKSPDFAMWLSVLPGAGQLYAHNARKAAEVYNEAKYAEIWQPVEAVLRSARQRYLAQSIGNP